MNKQKHSAPIPASVLQSGTGFKDLLSADKRPFLVVLLLGIIINIAGISTRFFTNDPSLYGMIARTMIENHNYTDLMYHGKDWLDKPHFPFWMTALSFNIFGPTTFAYKLPALLFYFMSVVYTYKLAKKLYSFETALLAVLVLLTSQHVIMSNTDVRAEPYIMGLLMGSVYHFYQLKLRFSIADLVLAALFAACAVMTKGIYLLIPIGSAIIGDYIFKKDFKGLFQWRWLMAVLLVAVFTLPEIYTLYVQFDLHPEKMVFGHHGVSGIRWFLWDSQFGRFNSSSYIVRTDGDKFFFVHTLLWAFAPWALLLYYALFISSKKIVKGIALPEYVTLSGAFLMFVIFSVSQFQLPFYTNILFPFFAIITAVFVQRVSVNNNARLFKITQYIITGALILLIIVLDFIFAPERSLIFILLILGLIGISVYIFKSRLPAIQSLFLFTCCVAVWANAYVIAIVYPDLLKYKGDVHAAEYVNRYVDNDKQVVAIFEVPDAFEFYTNRKVSFERADAVIAAKNKNQVVLVEDTLMAHLVKKNIPFKLVQKFDNYPNENLTLPFLIEKQRNTTLNHYFLITL
ncbi:ArnT family glycosyltransferase [Mucilaginibacter paludis]|uniref:Glycosyl transferase family 39 n=1 Tax=Mucilaginibacter paludis DSM 18603 TaxID=714943 RepID=H1XZI2_9SPHI|nr:glycosyltransferase family 39 protein [Mucilaginibacter paludis]EHQ26626.1 glycosyl transferase family 39 [Mucilaginibacter paludis DSM 18603]